MKLGISLFLGFAVTQMVFASNADVTKVVRLANTVKAVAVTTEASADDVRKAEEMLQDVVSLLAGESDPSEPGDRFSECYDFAYQKYALTFGAATSADKASALCKTSVQLDILKFLYEKYSLTYGSSTSLDKASAAAIHSLRGKLEIIKFLYEKYALTYGSATAVDRAVDGAQKVSHRTGLGCVKKLYASYSLTYGSASAMDQTIKQCSGSGQ